MFLIIFYTEDKIFLIKTFNKKLPTYNLLTNYSHNIILFGHNIFLNKLSIEFSFGGWEE